MHYQLNLRLAQEKKDYFWLFRSEEDTITVFNEVVEAFKEYEPPNSAAFIEEKRREIDETGRSNTVQIEVVKADKEALIRSAAYNEMWYEGKHFEDIYRTLTDKLGQPEEETFI
ncbi:hypothetical protein [Planococcus sp. NCCP-2050]|uniref:hypothetical protein n=1 Tax=Planococcus sp. NCCP-2050 TaxID=2944679 RepID=UPI0020426497|nr:hypothetical protein [Planococcus sp. NCCP-2050]GKW47043.1 hypothetical protein NCCP2050_27350 [Planococcus sp. NCCP-2050]